MITTWQSVSVDFFVKEILSRYWLHKGNTAKKIIEIQSFEFPMGGLKDADVTYRVFFGAEILPEEDYFIDNWAAKKLYNEDGYVAGIIMTGSNGYKMITPFFGRYIDGNRQYEVFLKFCLGYHDIRIPNVIESEVKPIYLWYNIDKEGKHNFSDKTPKPNRMIRIRTLDINDYQNIIGEFEKTHEFPKCLTKDDNLAT